MATEKPNIASSSPEPVQLIPAGKLPCCVHDGVFRKDTPEEHVRQRVARSLVEEYGYSKQDLHLEFPVKMGSGRPKKADIVVFPPDAPHKQEFIFTIVEAKREDVRPNDKDEGVEQLKSYLAASLKARWGLWVGSEMQAFEKEADPAKASTEPFPEATDIPRAGEQEPKRLEFGDLVPATEGLSRVFKRCHDYVHVNGHLGKEQAFFEFLKLIFCKVRDEQETSGKMQFSITSEERRSELGQRKLRDRIETLFGDVKTEYNFIFPSPAERIELDNRSLAYIVSELQKFNFQETPNDIKGEAYEEIVGVTSRRDQGAFFTPRNVCDMAVSLVFETYDPDERLRLQILDPACGTGGFLRAALLLVRDLLVPQALAKWSGDEPRAQADVARRLKKICDMNFNGIDKLSELVRAAQMNLAMHGDGSSNVYHANSLALPSEWPSNSGNDVAGKIKLGAFDVVLTNPPFGSKLPVDDPQILEQFEMAVVETKNRRTSMPPEQLFIERSLQFLKPGGRMAIVLPDSILSNPGLAFIRRWIMRRAYVIASIDLPRETFAKSDTHTMTSVLVLQRFTDAELKQAASQGKPLDYEIFMAIVDKVGWDKRGAPVYIRTPEGEEVVQTTVRTVKSQNGAGDLVEYQREATEPIIDDQLPAIRGLFSQWLTEIGPQPWMHD